MNGGRSAVVIGAGLVGPVTALMLARRGYRVDLYDRRPDPLTAPPLRGRSLHLVVSARGWRTLERLGCADAVRAISLPLQGRQIRPWRTPMFEQPYSRDGATIHCVERTRLHDDLAAVAREHPLITIHWGQRCRELDLAGRRVGFVRDDAPDGPVKWVPYERLCASDGVFSAVRGAAQGGRFDHRQTWLKLGYKEIRLEGADRLRPDLSPRHFQVWPRAAAMFTAFPNHDGSFTGSLFLPWEGSPSFADICTAADFRHLVRTFFPDLEPFTDSMWPQFERNPASGLVTVSCSPWCWDGRVILLGDAAHGVVPFFGQGMNCGFEDVFELERMLTLHGDAWPEALTAYERVRRPEVEALAALSLAHYDHLNHRPDPLDPLREQIGATLDRLAPWRFRPLYELVAFTTLPYATAARLDQLRRGLIEHLVRDPFFAGGWRPDAPDFIAAALRDRPALFPH